MCEIFALVDYGTIDAIAAIAIDIGDLLKNSSSRAAAHIVNNRVQ